jgi:D-alanine-D-alanine ligase
MRKKKKLKVAVIYNEAHPEFYIKTKGQSAKELNFVPFFEVENLTPIEEFDILVERLNAAGIEAYSLNIKDDLNTLLDNLKVENPDVIFNFIELFNENARLEMNIVSLLELMKIPFTGAPALSLANCQNKVLAKRILSQMGINTPRFLLVKEVDDLHNHKLNFPIIIKPAFEDASVGIENNSVVINETGLKKRVNYVFSQFNQPALVEEFIEGRELNVAVIGDENPRALPISEIDFSQMPGHLYNIVSYQAKWDPLHESYHKTIPVCPANLPKNMEQEAKRLAVKAFKTMACRDYARIDMRLTPEGKLYVLEVNPNPDLTEGAGFMRSAEAAGYSYTDTLIKIINLAWKRKDKLL